MPQIDWQGAWIWLPMKFGRTHVAWCRCAWPVFSGHRWGRRADGSAAAGEPGFLGGPAPDPLVGVLRKVVVGGTWRDLDLDQVLDDEAAPGHEPDPFPVRQRELPVGGA